jgi:hypothetical protein
MMLVVAEAADLISEAWPFISVAVAGYGAAVLKTAQDMSADATVAQGRRILQRIFRDSAPKELDMYAKDQSPSREMELRAAISRVLSASPAVADQVRDLLGETATPSENSSTPLVSNTVINSAVSGSIIQAQKIDTITFN